MTPMPIRTAIYARYSTDLQSERSCEDQIALCRAYASNHDLHVVDIFQDKAKSGASTIGRDGFQKMLRAAMEGQFDAILAESLDRLSRDMADLAGLFKRLTFAGIDLISVDVGKADTLAIGLRGIFGQVYREDNARKIRRGMTGLVRRGLSAGGKAYGYRPDCANRGRPLIVEQEATVVQRIYQDYAKGLSPKAICRTLNRELVRPPRGNRWQTSALLGMAGRGTGILRNELYVGRIVWGKVIMVRHPDTGKRISRPVPRDEWQCAEAPELRILPDELFLAVQGQLQHRANEVRTEPLNRQRRPKHLLSGLLKCGACGAGMAVSGKDKSGRTRLRCSAHTNSGTCPNPKTFYRDVIEELFIESLTQELASPDQIKKYADTYLRELRAKAVEEGRRRSEVVARLGVIERENSRLIDLMLIDGADTEALGEKSKALGRERDQLRIELARLPEVSNVVVHPSAVTKYKNWLVSARAKLQMTIVMLEDMGELRGLIDEIIEAVTLFRDDDGATVIKVDSYLEPFLTVPVAGQKSGPKSLGAVTMVAEEGLEPPTRGL